MADFSDVYDTSDASKVGRLLGLLEANGIQAFLYNEDFSRLLDSPEGPERRGALRLVVRGRDATDANALIHAFLDPEDPTFTDVSPKVLRACRRCRAPVRASAAVCGWCGEKAGPRS